MRINLSIQIPQSDLGREFEMNMNGEVMDRSWYSGESWEALEVIFYISLQNTFQIIRKLFLTFQNWGVMFDLWVAQCNCESLFPFLFCKKEQHMKIMK